MAKALATLVTSAFVVVALASQLHNGQHVAAIPSPATSSNVSGVAQRATPHALHTSLDEHWGSFVSAHANHLPLLNLIIEQLINLSFFWVPGTIYIALDCFCPSWASAHKLQPDAPMWTRRDLIDCLKVSGRNQLFPILVGTLLVLKSLVLGGGVAAERRDWGPLPSVARFVLEFAVCEIGREVLYYYAHRALHHPRLYARVHKMHHRFTAPIAFSAQYTHPLEQVLANMLPIGLPGLVLRIHTVTWWCFLAWQLFLTATVHSGFDFFARLGQFHDLHHELFRVNFGSLGTLDWVHGTGFHRAATNLKGEDELVDPGKGKSLKTE